MYDDCGVLPDERSQLYATALAEFLRRRDRQLTDRLTGSIRYTSGCNLLPSNLKNGERTARGKSGGQSYPNPEDRRLG